MFTIMAAYVPVSFKNKMTKNPAFPFYHRDFLHGTRRFSREQRGLYIELICEQADSETGSIPESEFEEICSGPNTEIVRRKFTKDENGYYNAKLREVMETRRKYVESRRKNLSKNKPSTHMEPHMDSHMANSNMQYISNENKEYLERLLKDTTAFYNREMNKAKGMKGVQGYYRFAGLLLNKNFKNELDRPVYHLLRIPKQVTFNQYTKLVTEAKKRSVVILDLLNSMINNPQYTEHSESIYLTLDSWIKRRPIQGTNLQ